MNSLRITKNIKILLALAFLCVVFAASYAYIASAQITEDATVTDGQDRAAYEFDGVNDGVKILSTGELSSVTPFEVSVSIYPESLGEQNQGWVISKAEDGDALPRKGWVLRVNDSPRNSLVFAVDHAWSHLEIVTEKDVIQLNEWNDVRVKWDGSKDGNNVQIFVNDVEVEYTYIGNGKGTIYSNDESDILLGVNDSLNRAFEGMIADAVVNGVSLQEDSNANNAEPEIEGCTDSTALNYDSNADVDDGSCSYPEPEPEDVPGCLDQDAVNFDSNANVSDGSCTYPDSTTQNETDEIWQPDVYTTWQWQLTGTVDTSIDAMMYDIDLFDVPVETITELQNKGTKVICYFSAGSYEDWRPDEADFPNSVLGSSNGWPGERWLDISNVQALRPVMEARLDLAVEKGCDGVEPDNIDGYTNNTGFSLTANDQLTYNIFLAEAAHDRGLSIGLKNDVEQASELEPYFDWALNEQCHQYNECDTLLPFVENGKPVFITEYNLSTSDFCESANAKGFMAMRKDLDLGASREVCWDESVAPNPTPDPDPVTTPDPTPDPDPVTTPDPQPTSLPVTYDARVMTTDLLNVRYPAGLDGAAIDQQVAGAQGTVLTTPFVNKNGYQWVSVNFDTGIDGWVASEFLQVITQ